MTRVVYLHVGAPKTGTTYLQDRLGRNVAALASHGVHVPTRSPMVSPGLFHFRAALDLLGQDWGGPPGHAEGSWEAMVRRVRRAHGTVIISHEILAPAPAEVVSRVRSDLGEDSEVHVVYTARDLAGALPAAWQESIKQGRRWSFRQFLRKGRTGQPWFWRSFDIPAVLSTWGAGLPPERLHLVTVPHRTPTDEQGEDQLWPRFCAATGIDPAWAPNNSDRANRSLGIAETQVLRALNRRLDRATRRSAPYDLLIREVLAQRELVRRTSVPVRLPPKAYDWVEEVSEQWVEWIRASGVEVVGDLDDLRPVRPPAGSVYHHPYRVRPRVRLAAALDALAAMTHEAASRPDPSRTLPTRVRARLARVRR